MQSIGNTAAGIAAALTPWPSQKSSSNAALCNFFTGSKSESKISQIVVATAGVTMRGPISNRIMRNAPFHVDELQWSPHWPGGTRRIASVLMLSSESRDETKQPIVESLSLSKPNAIVPLDIPTDAEHSPGHCAQSIEYC